jgi:hypothetical protein
LNVGTSILGERPFELLLAARAKELTEART